jgi:hypothetical protein
VIRERGACRGYQESANRQAMRNGQNNNKHRMRGRNRSGKSHNPLTRVYESNGPDVKIRGTANHVAEKYIQLARDATASGDPVAAENYYQHAEHYFRLIAAAQEQFRQTTPFQQRDGGEQRNDESYDDGDDGQPNYGSSEPYSPRDREQSYQQQPQPPRDSQPYQPREQREHREQPYQPREQRDYQPRHDSRPPRQDSRQDRQPYQDNRQPSPANGAPDDDVDRLPSFITGGSTQAAPQANGDSEQQGDRFPLHRRRRRGHRGPRPDVAGGEGGDDAPQSPPPAGE